MKIMEFIVFHSKDLKNLCKNRYGVRCGLGFHGVAKLIIFFITMKFDFKVASTTCKKHSGGMGFQAFMVLVLLDGLL